MTIKSSGIPIAKSPVRVVLNPGLKLVDNTTGISAGLKNPETNTTDPANNLPFGGLAILSIE